jgi:hypothetical protein
MLNRDFKEFVEWFNAHGVEYLLVGGYALAAHGHPRYTGDIDFWIRRDPANIARVLAALADFGFGSVGLKPEDFSLDAVIQLGMPPRRIDLLTAIDGVEFEGCYRRREVIKLDGVALPLIGLEDFKANKRASGRHKDLADLEALEPPSPPVSD